MFLNYSGTWRNGKGSSTKQIFDTCIKHSYHKSCSSFIARRRIALFNSSRDCRETTSVIKYKIPSVPAYWLVLQVAVHVNIASVAKQEKHWNTLKEEELDLLLMIWDYLSHQGKTLADIQHLFIMLQLHLTWIVLVSVVAELRRWIVWPLSFGLIQSHVLDCQTLGDSWLCFSEISCYM